MTKRALLATLIGVAAVGHGSMQTRNAAEGPWSGWVQCELTAQLNEPPRTYFNQQTHTWVLTASTPASGTDIKEYPVTWTVAGGGTGTRQEGNGRTVADKWNTTGQPMSTTISFRVDLAGTLIIALRAAQLSSVGATTGMSVAHSTNGNAPDQTTQTLPLAVEEFRFPAIRDDGTKTSITGSFGPTPIPSVASGQPPRTVSTATCSWNLVRGGAAPPPPRGVREQLGLPREGPVLTGRTPPISAGGSVPVSVANVPAQATAGPTPTIANVPAQATAGPPTTTQAGLPPTLAPTAPPAATKVPATITGLTADPGPCKLTGPVMVPAQVVVTPGSVQLVWQGDAFSRAFATNRILSDVEYTVRRTDLGGAALVGSVRKGGGGFGYYADASATWASEQSNISGLPVGPMSFLHRAKFDDSRSYVYTVTASHFHYDVVQVPGNPFPINAQVADGCGITEFRVTPPKIQTPVLTSASTARGGVTIAWKMPSDQQQTGFLVLGAGLPSEGRTAGCCGIQIANVPTGSQSWLIAPYWDTPEGRMINASAGLRVTQTIAPWTDTPGLPPTGINVKSFPTSDPVAGSCFVNMQINWAPVPGSTGYTVYVEGGPTSPRIPLTTFSFNYREGQMALSDLGKAVVLGPISDYASSPQFTRGVSVKVAASFGDRPDGMSAPVPYSFSTFPCSDGRNFPSDP